MKDIKELAPELAHRTCNRYKHGDEWPYQFTEQGVIDYATRLIAAYTEGEEPDESQNWKGMSGAVAWHLIDRHGEDWADIGNKMDSWLKANTAPPEPAPQQEPLHVGDSQFESWFSTYWSASLRNGSKQIARDAYAAGMGDPLVAPAACAAPSSEEVREQRIATLEQQNAELVAALRDWDGLMEYNYSGSREAMSAMQQCAFDTKDILDKVKQP